MFLSCSPEFMASVSANLPSKVYLDYGVGLGTWVINQQAMVQQLHRLAKPNQKIDKYLSGFFIVNLYNFFTEASAKY